MKLTCGVAPPDLHITHLREGRSLFQDPQKVVQLHPWSFCQDFHTAIREILDASGDSQPSSRLLRKRAVPDPLHSTGDDDDRLDRPVSAH